MADGSSSSPIELHEIPYDRLFPWVRLFRAFAVATDPRKLLLAALGLLLMHAGWRAIDWLIPGPEGRARFEWLDLGGLGSGEIETFSPWATIGLLFEPVRDLAGPFLTILNPRSSWQSFGNASLTVLWSALVWGLAGGAIVRMALVRVAQGEGVGLRRAVRFAARYWRTLAFAPLIPFLAVGVFAALCAPFGLLYRIPAVGPVLAGLFAVVPLLIGLALTLILLGLALGWPLMLATVAAEEEDSYGAVSRMYAYVNQRRGYYLGYVFLAWLVGEVGLVFVALAGVMVRTLTEWALSFGAPSTVLAAFFGPARLPADTTAQALHAGWLALVALLVHGWIYSYFWTAVAIIYLLLRQSVDGTPIHELAGLEAGPGTVVEPGSIGGPEETEPAPLENGEAASSPSNSPTRES